jgi:hypothetical protein
MLATSEDAMAGTVPFVCLADAVAVTMQQRSVQHRVFIVESSFFFYGDPVAEMKRIFRKHIYMAPSCNTIQLRVENFGTSASALKKKPPGTAHRV